jgi:hypothetical protein
LIDANLQPFTRKWEERREAEELAKMQEEFEREQRMLNVATDAGETGSMLLINIA